MGDLYTRTTYFLFDVLTYYQQKKQNNAEIILDDLYSILDHPQLVQSKTQIHKMITPLIEDFNTGNSKNSLKIIKCMIFTAGIIKGTYEAMDAVCVLSNSASTYGHDYNSEILEKINI